MGRGAAGKSTLAADLGRLTRLPVIELDERFWRTDLSPTPRAQWISLQAELAAGDRWIMDGDLGRHDAPGPLLARADTVVVLDLPVMVCALRAARRSRERWDFWWWLLTWRRRSRRVVLDSIAVWAPRAELHMLRSTADGRRFLAAVSAAGAGKCTN